MVRIIKYLLGMTLIALAINLELDAKVGAAALDIVQANIAYLLKVDVGIGILIFSGLLLILTMIISKNLKALWSLIPLVIVSLATDLFTPLVESFFGEALLIRIIQFSLSLIFMALGAALMIVSNLPTTPYDNLVVSIVDNTGYSISKVRLASEIGFVILGALLAYLSGNLWTTFNAGTFIYAVTTSYLLQFFVKKLKRS